MSKKLNVEKIIHFGDKRLRTACAPVEVFHKGLHNKIDIIAATLKKHGGGAALAAPQIALLKRIVVIDYLGEYFELVNPEITEKTGEQTGWEGCLSLPGFSADVTRYDKITVAYHDRFGNLHTVEADGRMARCFQHEIDHLDGVLYVDHVTDDFVVNDETGEKVAVRQLLNLAGERSL